jgi:hypothetical protein
VRIAEQVAYGMLRVSERKFRKLTLIRLIRAMEWFLHEDEARLKQTRLICYFSGNHKANSPEGLWMTAEEMRLKQLDIIEGRIPIAKFRKLTPEEVKAWPKTRN